MNMHEFLKALPKVSLHVHLMGSVQASTVVELGNKHGVPLPEYEEPEDLYDYPDIYKFLTCSTTRAGRTGSRGLPPDHVRDPATGC